MPFKNLSSNNLQLIRQNTSLVKKLYRNINRARVQALRELTKQFSFSFASGDLTQLENGWYVTHTGLGSPSPPQALPRYPRRGGRIAL